MQYLASIILLATCVLATSMAAAQDCPSVEFDISPFRTFAEHETMRHLISSYPNSLSNESAGRDIYSILIRVDSKFEQYCVDDV